MRGRILKRLRWGTNSKLVKLFETRIGDFSIFNFELDAVFGFSPDYRASEYFYGR